MYITARGGYRVFLKGGGLRPAIRNAGGGGGVGGWECAVRFRPDTKSGGGEGGGGAARFRPDTRSGGGGGGAFHLRPDTKSGGGEGGGGCCPALQARYKKRGRERGCLAEEGALPYMKGGVATPKPPPPWIRL